MAKDDKKDKKTKKPKVTLRERNVKAKNDEQKPKRARKAATAAVKPVGKFVNLLKTEYHLVTRREEPGFFTKSRGMVPSYFVNSIAELKYVTWPKRRETWKLVFAVFVFAIIIGVVITLLDFGLEKVFKKVILDS